MGLTKTPNKVIDNTQIDHALESTVGHFSGYQKMIAAILVVLLMLIIIKIIDKSIDHHLQAQEQKMKESYKRIVTIMGVVKKIIKGIFCFVGVMVLMGIFGISTSPLLTIIGVGTVALGIGAKDLVQDIINGFFIIFEDQYSVGDIVEICGYSGHVEELGLRCTKVRDFDGLLHIIPNSKIAIVTNKERGTVRGMIRFPISVEEKPSYVIALLEKELEPYSHHEKMVQGPLVWGVTQNGREYNELTVVFYTAQGDQYDLEYEIRRKIIELMQREQIETSVVKNIIREG